MEACVVVCRAQKPSDRRRKVLFIDAVDEVARERGQSFLKPAHQARILDTFQAFADQPGFAKVATIAEVLSNDSNLSIPRYVRPVGSGASRAGERELITPWRAFDTTGGLFWVEMEALATTLATAITQSAGDA